MFNLAFLHFVLTGSPAAGTRLATAYTFVESARRRTLGTERVRAYLNNVISRLEASCPLQDLHGLVPDAWLANKTAEQRARDATSSAVCPSG
jgi:hypothetical protein